jgi:hypothetical protein
MAELSENTTVEIPLRNLVALGAGIVMATTAYVTLDTRITGVEHGHEMHQMQISDNADFVREWPLGLRGALPDDLIQNANIMSLQEKVREMNEMKREMRTMEIEIGRLRSQTETQEEKIETLFELWNSKVATN